MNTNFGLGAVCYYNITSGKGLFEGATGLAFSGYFSLNTAI